MEKEIELVIEDLKELFNIEDNQEMGIEKDGSFFINKQKMERHEVIEKIENYFKDIKVKDGYVLVSPITLVYTKFEVCSGVPKEMGL